jgi:hypothetical protein
MKAEGTQLLRQQFVIRNGFLKRSEAFRTGRFVRRFIRRREFDFARFQGVSDRCGVDEHFFSNRQVAGGGRLVGILHPPDKDGVLDQFHFGGFAVRRLDRYGRGTYRGNDAANVNLVSMGEGSGGGQR